MTDATTEQIKAALETALRTPAARRAGSWDRGGVALEIARTALAKQGLRMPTASFDEDTIEVAGLTVEIC